MCVAPRGCFPAASPKEEGICGLPTGLQKTAPPFFGSRGGVETDFPLVILAGLELAMLDQVGHGFCFASQVLGLKMWGNVLGWKWPFGGLFY